MRGLKHITKNNEKNLRLVASFTDAWIETLRPIPFRRDEGVASFTDAWIET